MLFRAWHRVFPFVNRLEEVYELQSVKCFRCLSFDFFKFQIREWAFLGFLPGIVDVN